MVSAGEGGYAGDSFGGSSKMVESKQDQQYGIKDIITYIAVNEDGSKSFPMLYVTNVLQNGVEGIDLNRSSKTFREEIKITFGDNYSLYAVEKRGVNREKLEEIIKRDKQQPGRLIAFIANL